MSWSDIGKYTIRMLIERNKLSIGRIMLLGIFIASFFRWMNGLDIPSTMATILLALLAYVLSSKVVDGVSSTVEKLKGNVVNNVLNVVEKVEEKESGGKTPDVDNL